MNRRTFFRNLLGAVASIALAPRLARLLPEVTVPLPVNELAGWEFIYDPEPMRFVLGADGIFAPVEMFIEGGVLCAPNSDVGLNPEWINAEHEADIYRKDEDYKIIVRPMARLTEPTNCCT